MVKLRAVIRAVVKPTEDPEKVKRALRKLFPTIDVNLIESCEGPAFIGEAEGRSVLETLREKFRSRLVNEAVRAALLKRKSGRRTVLYLNRQAAYMGKAYLTEWDEEPLAPIEVIIESDDLEGFIKWFTAY